MRLLTFLVVLAVVYPAAAQLPEDMIQLHLYTVRDAVARGAVCNDGSPAKYYFRDCPRPGPECLLAPDSWNVVFGGGQSADT